MWVKYVGPVFTKEQVERATKKATVWQKIRLLFRKNRYSIDTSEDGTYIMRYKEMDGEIFVMGNKFKPTPQRGKK